MDRSSRAAALSTWAAGAISAAGSVAVWVVLRGTADRLAAVEPVLAAAAIALAASAITLERARAVSGVLLGAAALTLVYGMLVAVAVPLRLGVTGTCPESMASCPLGYEHPITSPENLAVEIAVASGVSALIAIAASVNVRLRSAG